MFIEKLGNSERENKSSFVPFIEEKINEAINRGNLPCKHTSKSKQRISDMATGKITLPSLSANFEGNVKIPFSDKMVGSKWSPILAVELVRATNVQFECSASIWKKIVNRCIKSILGININLSINENNNSTSITGVPSYSNKCWSNLHGFQKGNVSSELVYSFNVKIVSCFSTDDQENKFQIRLEPKLKAFIGIIPASEHNVELIE